MQNQATFLKVNWLRLITYFILPIVITVILFIGMVFGVYIPAIQKNFVNAHKETLNNVVSIAYHITDYYYRACQSGTLSETEAQKQAIEMIRSIRFGREKDRYFWIHNVDNILVMHPFFSELEGENLESFKDANGESFFLKMTRVALKESAGYVSYPWRQPSEQKESRQKISYIRLFEPWGWIIGSGYPTYLDVEVQNIIDQTNQTLAFVLVGLILVCGFMALQSVRADEERETLLQILEESEKDYRELVQTAKSIILKMDCEGNVTFVNEFAQSFFGFSEEELLGKNVVGRIVPEKESTTGRDLREMILKIGKDPDSFLSNVNENLTKAGERVWISWTNQPIFNAQNVLVGVLCVGNDISLQKSTEEELQKKSKALELLNSKLRYLYQHIYDIRDDERRVIAREIHDELGQLMTAIRMDISLLQKNVQEQSEQIPKKFEDIFQLIDTTVDSIRRISGRLHPAILDDLGLISAIEWYMESFQKRSGLVVNIDLPRVDVPQGAHDIVVFRALQESLTNVSRHSEATKVDVELKYSEQKIYLRIKDNGVGISSEEREPKNSLGLVGMRERIQIMGGTVDVKSAVGQGTEIFILLPVRS